jgi:hypothetical protein
VREALTRIIVDWWDGKRGVGHRPQATAPILDSTWLFENALPKSFVQKRTFTVMSWRFLATSLRQFGTRTELILYRSHRIRDQIISALVDDLDRVASRLKGKGVSFAKELQTPRPGSHVLHSSFFWLAYGSVPLSFLLEGFERQ